MSQFLLEIKLRERVFVSSSDVLVIVDYRVNKLNIQVVETVA
jgi:hypothetical protein